MLAIYKYEVPAEEHFALELPIGSKILDVQVQRGKPQIWVLHNTTQPKVKRVFLLASTGMPLNPTELENSKYIGTFQRSAGIYVFHLFEVFI